jgi:hypothetical protein
MGDRSDAPWRQFQTLSRVCVSVHRSHRGLVGILRLITQNVWHQLLPVSPVAWLQRS